MDRIDLKPKLLLGVAGSATQYDGGNLGHTWNLWYSAGKIHDGSDPAAAAGHWERWKSDAMLMGRMGIETYRMSIEWARVEPTEGCFDEYVIDRLKEELMLLNGLGIRPMITLHHFTNPLWFEVNGGWAEPKNIVYYLRYVERIIRRLGHLCDDYITINEPNVYALNGYRDGIWPPGKKKLNSAMEVMSVMAAAHIRAYRLIHRLRAEMGLSGTRVGVALHMRVFAPKSRANPAHSAAAALGERLFQTLIAEAVTLGKFSAPLRNYARVRPGRYCDFHGLNYYSRSTLSGLADGARAYCAKSDLGWEIYPQGLIICAQKLMKLCSLPVYVTENGVCDNADAFRCRFIFDQLMAINRSGLPIERYYYWSFLDNFEWLEGMSARFGLVSVEPETMERTVKKSGRFYAELIKEHGITPEMYRDYISIESYHH
ncbi:MAG: glycoside hydrolase family 1 protein [Candidatus Heteroscillospira sp.]|jgi:beta-glucosidase